MRQDASLQLTTVARSIALATPPSPHSTGTPPEQVAGPSHHFHSIPEW